MKNLTVLVLSLFILSCNQKKETKDSEQSKEEETNVSIYPDKLIKVFKSHGGLQKWKEKRTLSFDIDKPENPETHIVDLFSRKDKIETRNYTMGFDGGQVWLLDGKESYKGDPVFYHNLMFYFYAMPFVLADKGIVYGETENLSFEGREYPGISISYSQGIGTSYKDEYFIHYNPDTYQMEWLGYTVTYRTGEKSDNIKWIRYNDWLRVDGVELPKSITWYKYEGKNIKEAVNTVSFENVSLSVDKMPVHFYEKPEMAKVIEGKVQM
ncbi:hypothetical protein GGR42_002778 [Saonia flava]|uniref:Threonine synthase n=1 Tax=Saonia flava TaxID=523696 RepID=A0A846QYK2_9FLAO|nr:DUF6503 family protein [Saonia flava]NJB72287.1 hypothetical protein [Saonia flava]